METKYVKHSWNKENVESVEIGIQLKLDGFNKARNEEILECEQEF